MNTWLINEWKTMVSSDGEPLQTQVVWKVCMKEIGDTPAGTCSSSVLWCLTESVKWNGERSLSVWLYLCCWGAPCTLCHQSPLSLDQLSSMWMTEPAAELVHKLGCPQPCWQPQKGQAKQFGRPLLAKRWQLLTCICWKSELLLIKLLVERKESLNYLL